MGDLSARSGGQPASDETLFRVSVKTCKKCGATKPLEEFARHKQKKDGHFNSCRPCLSATRKAWAQATSPACLGCGKPTSSKSSLRCRSCAPKARSGENHHAYKGGRSVSRGGYVYLSGYFDHPNAKAGSISEHVLVMSQMLGRPLTVEENVHHKNGVRDDNRPENLELWSKKQPPGQRVEDKIAWAREILQMYRPELLKEES